MAANPAAPPERLLWTPRDTAASMGICEKTLWSLTNRGNLPCVRIGRAVRYDPRDITIWIDQQKQK